MQVQTVFNIKSAKEIEIDGVGMGVLEDGTPYLTGRGLARMCGIGETTLRDFVTEWNSQQFNPRGEKIANLLADQGYLGKPLFIPIEVEGSKHHAYPEAVCMAFLEYYAFDASPIRDHAKSNYRLLARSSLRAFIYVQLGYDPRNQVPLSWKQFHDRVSLTYNSVPDGYFGVFKEIAEMVIAMIQSEVPVDDKTVPDISVGISWGKHWNEQEFNEKFGRRVPYEHNYPDYFPQSKSNPQLPWAYPDTALGEFRRWLRNTYFTEKFPKYIGSQCQKRALPPSIGQLAIEAVAPKQITANRP